MENQNNESSKPRVVCCIGDIHGYMSKLQRLWTNLELLIGTSDFQTALVIFLGDYCDRGPDTRQVIDFLISLPSRYPKQSHVFLCGNHDLAFGAFLGVLPSPPDGCAFSETWKEYENHSYKTWPGDRPGKVTGSPGLEKDKGVDEQLKSLKSKDTSIPKVEALSGRKNVWEIPEELNKTPTIIVSGHHGKLHVEGLRLIIDEGGGLENNPVAAMVLPSQKIVRDTDTVEKTAIDHTCI